MNSGIKSLLSPRGVTKTPQARRQSILPSFKTPMRGNVTGRLNQSSSQILHKSTGFTVEHFGSQLPVLITEALKYSDGNSAASVNISSDGWAWFVCGRRLLVWEASGARPVSTQCRELSLPPSDLAHRAHLVTVYTQQASQMPCCLAVSPEGIVRYWSSIAHESSWIEVNADLQGQECDSLHLLLPLGALLVTTTATLVLVTPHFAAARHALLCRTIKTPHGWLGGISRKMSSLIFGSIPATQIMETKLVKVVTSSSGNGKWSVTVLAGHSLQKWQLCGGEMEQLLFEADLARPLREAFAGADHNVQELLLLDMKATYEGVMLLVAGAQDTSQVTYAFVAVRIEEMSQLSVSWFRQLTAEDLVPLAHSSQTDSTLQFLLMSRAAFVYNSTHIIAIPVLGDKGDVELLDFGPGQIIGGALFGGMCVFFSTFSGFISVSSTTESIQNDMSLTMNDIPDPGISDSNIEELTQQNDNVGLLKAAFLLYIRKQHAHSKAALGNLFSGEASSIDAMLGTAVLQTSLELIDDVPAKDPRWADQKSSKLSIANSNSLQIVHQLEEKQKVLQWYISFLKDMQLWDKLGSVTNANRVIATTYVLQEHAEKVVATLALKKAHSKNAELVDKIIEDVLAKHNKRPFGSLTNQDLFYRQTSLIHEAIHQLVRWSEDIVYTEKNSQLVANQLVTANSLLLDMLRAVSELREQISAIYQPSGVWERKLWTMAGGNENIGDALLLQIQMTAGGNSGGVKDAGTPQLKAELLDQLLSLVDFVLDGRKSHVESLRDSALFPSVLHQYEADRLSYIKLFMAEEEYERAAMLGEKYLDFQVLIDICERTNNKEKLNSYIEKFNNQGFSNFLFSWYLREQKQSSLVQHCNERGGEQLVPLLDEHPTLSWLHDLAQQRYQKVSDTLKRLAQEEIQLLQRKKSQLSLAKLAVLASPDPASETLGDLTSALTLISFQEHLPDTLLNAYGCDAENIRLFTPSELIKLYISEENQCTEFNFKTALDILGYVEDNQERNELNNEIWCKAILKDSWTDLDPNSSPEAIQQLFFFRLFDLCIIEGCEDMIPGIEGLLSTEELGDLKDDSTFHFLLQVGYEHFNKD